jgi:RHS repeat-associated protein
LVKRHEGRAGLYGLFGASIYQSGLINTAKGYTGQVHDGVSGLDYYMARYYDPVMGMFLSVDIVQGNQQGMNSLGDNPEIHNDPSGHCWPWCTMLAGAIAGAVIGAGISAISQAASGHGVNWGEVGKAAIVGGITGGIAGLAGPGAPVAQILGTAATAPVAAGFAALGAVAGAAGNAAGQVANNALHGQSLGNGVAQAALVGGVTGAAFGALQIATPLGRTIAGPLFSRFGRAMTFTLDNAATSDADAELAQQFVDRSNDLLVRPTRYATSCSPSERFHDAGQELIQTVEAGKR